MPYNGSGSFSVVNTFTPNTTISSSAMNANFTDMAQNGLSAVLPRDGQAAMTAQLPLAPGSVSLPALAWAVDANTGLYRIGPDNFGGTCGGVKIIDVGPDGLDVTGEITQNGSALTIPIGLIMDFAGSSAPDGYLLCFGQAILRSTYSDLFGVIGTTYGIGDGTTTFNIPDLRGRVIAGKDNMGGSSANRLTIEVDGDVLGDSGGAETHTLIAGEIASGLTGTTSADTVTTVYQATSIVTGSIGPGTPNFVRAPGSGSDASVSNTHTHTVTAGGSDDPHNNVQPTIILNKIIRTGV